MSQCIYIQDNDNFETEDYTAVHRLSSSESDKTNWADFIYSELSELDRTESGGDNYYHIDADWIKKLLDSSKWSGKFVTFWERMLVHMDNNMLEIIYLDPFE